MKRCLLLCAALFTFNTAFADQVSEAAASRYLASIHDQPQKIKKFMHDLPKGGDLHHHASGSTFAEKMIGYAANDHLCVNRETYAVYANSQCPASDLLNAAISDIEFYDALIDAWSMHHFFSGKESGHDHFFHTFGKFGAISHQHIGEILAEITDRAANQNELYIETLLTPDGNQSGQLGKKLGFDPDFARMRSKLLANGFNDIVAGMSTYLDDAEAKMRSVLGCGTSSAKAGCGLKLRYQYQVHREQAPEMVFAQLLAGFEVAGKEKRIVGVNMVMPEDGPISMRDYKLHMQMIGFLHSIYPDVQVSLHAGELSKEIAPEQGLTFHINDAVNVAHAERIGHGVDIINENNYPALLQTMANHHIMVEINLSSNAGILNIEGKNHPLPLYMQYGVPVALSTDDEGVTRDILTTEYVKAFTTYHIDYATLKKMVRNSISYGFLPGDNLWQDHDYRQMNTACARSITAKQPAAACKTLLKQSEKAALQWELEKRFADFESKF